MKLPTEFRGVTFDDHWEFDAPTVVYYPFFMYGIGGNSGEFERLVEDWCIDTCCDILRRRGLSEIEEREFKWRRWNKYGMKNRKRAWHSKVSIRWYIDEDGEQAFEMGEVKRQEGPFK